MSPKKLIEVALPLEKINDEASREKSIRHGHPSTLHLWWARRPLAAARAVIWASLVDDPSSHPEKFPTEEAQNAERRRLFDILEQLIVWENSNDSDILSAAKEEIMKSTGGNPPALLDPFAGGGSIPLEAQRLGLEAHASDLNPVAVMINKAMIEIPFRFANQDPVNPNDRKEKAHGTSSGAEGLAADVRYYGEWMREEAFKKIGSLYPKVKLPAGRESQGAHGQEATVIAWNWARTVKCPNPACGCEMPLVRSFQLSKKGGKEFHVEPVIEDGQISYRVKPGKKSPPGTINRRGATCICCGTPVDFVYIRSEFNEKRSGVRLMAIVAEGVSGRVYLSPDEEHIHIAIMNEPDNCPEGALPEKALGFRVQLYGMTEYKDLFTNRQLTALTTLSELVGKAQEQAEKDALEAGMSAGPTPLAEGGAGAKAYGQAVGVYMAFLVDKLADYHSSLCSWINSNEQIGHTFVRQAISMVWDFVEGNPFSSSSGSYKNMLDLIVKCVAIQPANHKAFVSQHDAQSDNGLRDVMVSTDPPYYDNIGYADLSDYFYIWMRHSLKDTYPDLFKTLLVPKGEELIATPYRFDGSKERAKLFFEEGMLKACTQINQYTRADIPVTIYYAFKQSDTETTDDSSQTASTGWETMLSAIIKADFAITGTWPMRTERSSRMRMLGSNALASSIVLVCRKRPADAPSVTRRGFLNELRRELKPALQKLQQSNIAPVDLAQSAIGPGMGVYSRYSQVLEADGTPMSVRSALQIINQELDIFFNEQDGELDRESRFCVDLWTQYAFNDVKFGEADILARAKNTYVEKLAKAGVLSAQKGIVHLLKRDEITEKVDPREPLIWLLTQQLTQAMETGGIKACAEIIAPMRGSNTEQAKALAYRLYTIADRKGWSQEAFAYNSLVLAWREILTQAAEIAAKMQPESVQRTFNFEDYERGEAND